MSMAVPKNTSTTDYVLSGCSALGALMSAYAAYAGPGTGAIVPAQYFINFTIIAFGLYAVGFFLAPALLIDMNFTVTQDSYHAFLGRFSGYTMCIVCYVLYAMLSEADAFFICGMWSLGCALLGPTYAGLYLSPKQTPEGHLPAHFLFLIGGGLGVAGTM